MQSVRNFDRNTKSLLKECPFEQFLHINPAIFTPPTGFHHFMYIPFTVRIPHKECHHRFACHIEFATVVKTHECRDLATLLHTHACRYTTFYTTNSTTWYLSSPIEDFVFERYRTASRTSIPNLRVMSFAPYSSRLTRYSSSSINIMTEPPCLM